MNDRPPSFGDSDMPSRSKGMTEGSRPNPSPSRPPNKSKGDSIMAGSTFEKVGEQFFMWSVVRYIKTYPIKAIAEGVCFLAIGGPFSYGLAFGYQVNIPGIGFFTVPASTLGIAVRSGIATIGSATIREDGTPILYPEGVVEIKRIGTGVTLEDLESANQNEQD